jgi:hypothetical protein
MFDDPSKPKLSNMTARQERIVLKRILHDALDEILKDSDSYDELRSMCIDEIHEQWAKRYPKRAYPSK